MLFIECFYHYELAKVLIPLERFHTFHQKTQRHFTRQSNTKYNIIVNRLGICFAFL